MPFAFDQREACIGNSTGEVCAERMVEILIRVSMPEVRRDADFLRSKPPRLGEDFGIGKQSIHISKCIALALEHARKYGWVGERGGVRRGKQDSQWPCKHGGVGPEHQRS